jgi:hypothetical protein
MITINEIKRDPALGKRNEALPTEYDALWTDSIPRIVEKISPVNDCVDVHADRSFNCTIESIFGRNPPRRSAIAV